MPHAFSPTRFPKLARDPIRSIGASERDFDGVICFGGEDWWYHNRGHFDLQIMRELSRHVPVLYVNSIGMRMPRTTEGRMFLRRMLRKLRSLNRGFARVREDFAVLSPVTIPGRTGLRLTGPTLAPQVRRAARRMGITRPLVWIACPPAAVALDPLDPVGVVYQRTDRYECFGSIDADEIAAFDRWLKARADLTVFCTEDLFSNERDGCRDACLVDHGVDFDQFEKAGSRRDPDHEPLDMRDLPRPRIGFVGGVDRHTFDEELFNEVVGRLPEVTFAMIGASSLPEGWCTAANVHFLGRKPYEQVASYMAACDVLIMPWNNSPWIKACNPVKLKEYLAVGRPVVSTPFPELTKYEPHVQIAPTAKEFADAIRVALDSAESAEAGQATVKTQSWASKASHITLALEIIGIGSPALQPLIESSAAEVEREVSGVEPKLESTTPAASSKEVLATIGHQGIEVASCLVNPTDREYSIPRSSGDHRIFPRLSRPVTVIMLAGGLKPSPIMQKTGLSVLDLAIADHQTLLGCWHQELSISGNQCPTEMHVVTSEPVPTPQIDLAFAGAINIAPEARTYRGPAGVVRDMLERIAPEDDLLILEAGRYPAESVWPLLWRHWGSDADVTIGRNPDATPAGVIAAKRSAVEQISIRGFVDLKEQWLKRVKAGGGLVDVHPFQLTGIWPVSGLEGLLNVARHCTGVSRDTPVTGLIRGAGAQGVRVVAPDAIVGAGARVIDSIVMRGAVIEPRAIVVRSLVCPHSRVQSGHRIADAILGASYARTGSSISRAMTRHTVATVR